MEQHEISYLSPLKEFAEAGSLKWLDGNQLWVHQYPFDTWTHPHFSDTTIDVDRATKLKESFDKGVKGVKIFADYEHGLDPAKGNKASGNIQELKVVTEPRGVFSKPGLWARVQFSDIARKEIEAGEWNYWSTSHYDTWTHPQTQEKHDLVYDGGGLTNKPYVKGMAPLNFSDLGITKEQAEESVVDETPPVEIVEDKGTPELTAAEKLAADLSVDNNSDINDNEGGDKDVELEKQLREKLGLDPDADIIKAVTDLNDEVAPMREALKVHSEKKNFSEAYPEQAKKLEQLEQRDRENEAKKFSESFAGVRLTEGKDETTKGFSALVLNKLQETAKQFSDGIATIDTVKELMEAVKENGIVDYGTKGSSREDEKLLFNEDQAAKGNVQDVRKQFAEKVTEVMREDKIEDYMTALRLTADKYPKLAEAYHSAGMGQ